MTTNEPVDLGECTRCGYLMLPVPALSPCGHDAPVELRPLESPGRVYAWTRTHLQDADQVIVMADFLDGRLRVTAPLAGADAVAIGDRVLLKASKAAPYQFQLAP